MPHVTFVHGIANKIAADDLHREWLDALRDAGGLDLPAAGVTTSMCYWADVLYAAPVPPAPAGSDESVDDPADAGSVLSGEWFDSLPPDEQARVRELAAEVGAVEALAGPADAATADADTGGTAFEGVPLPGPVRRKLMAVFLRDVHHYLWNTEVTPRPGETYLVRTEVRRRLVEALRAADSPRPHVLVGHSLGSVIAYDVLRNDPTAPGVDGLLTLGSPLGLDEVQGRLAPGWSRWDGFPSDAVATSTWANVFDRRDPVCGLDPAIANDFRRQGREIIADVDEPNWGSWRHAVVKYLRGPKLQRSLAAMLDMS